MIMVYILFNFNFLFLVLQMHRYFIATESKNTKLQDIAKCIAISFANGETEILKRDKLPKTEIFWDFFSLFYEINPNSLWVHSSPPPAEVINENINIEQENSENVESNSLVLPALQQIEASLDTHEKFVYFPTFDWQSISICDSISSASNSNNNICSETHYYFGNSLLSQFIVANQLTPVRILLYGAPASGKSLASSLLESKLGLPVINILDLIKNALDKVYSLSLLIK